MAQVVIKKKKPEIKLEEVVLEEVHVKQDLCDETKPQEKQKPVKKALLKLLKKSKYNAKYLEELLSPDTVKRSVYDRNYGYLLKKNYYLK